MDFFNSGLPLGRWFRVQMTLSWFFLLFVGYEMFEYRSPMTVIQFFGVVFVIVVMHEFGHVITCRATGGTADQIVITILGGYTITQSPPNPFAHLATACGGPLVHVVLLAPLWAATYFLPQVAGIPPVVYGILFEAWEINLLLLVLNLLPFYPLDGGRILQSILWFFLGYDRSCLVAGMVGTVGGVSMVLIGFNIFTVKLPGALGELFNVADYWIAIIGIMIAMQSFAYYQAAHRRMSQRH